MRAEIIAPRSLGIGGDVAGEKNLFQRYPQCGFLGVDPVEDENRPLVEGLKGRFVKGAVGARTGRYKARILEGKA